MTKIEEPSKKVFDKKSIYGEVDFPKTVEDMNRWEEKVNHPHHYGGDTTYEAIKVIEAWKLDFCLGNTVKYISRAGRKDPEKELEDLKKAKWYLEREIQQLTELEKLHH